jgi:hypothetical protein
MKEELFVSVLQQERCKLQSPVMFLVSSFFFIYFFFVVALRPIAGHGLLILEVSRSYTTTHHSR